MPAPDPSFVSVYEKDLGKLTLETVINAAPKNKNYFGDSTGEVYVANVPTNQVKKKSVDEDDLLGIDLLGGDENHPNTNERVADLELLDLDGGDLLGNPSNVSNYTNNAAGVDSNNLMELDLMGGETTSGVQSPNINSTNNKVEFDLSSFDNNIKNDDFNYGNDINNGKNSMDDLNLLGLGNSINKKDNSTSSPIKQQPKNDLMDLDLIGGSGIQSPNSYDTKNTNLRAQSLNDDMDLLGENHDDLIGGGSSKNELQLSILSDENIAITLSCLKISATRAKFEAQFSNKTNSIITNVKLLVSVVKYLDRDLGAPSGSNLQPRATAGITQGFEIENKMQGEKPIIIRLKVVYTMNGNNHEQIATVDQIPLDF